MRLVGSILRLDFFLEKIIAVLMLMITKCKFYPPPSASQPSPQSMLMSVIEFKLPTFQGHKRAVSAPDSGGAGKVKAKMGMLIIHGMGQDMMDLLVAANMSAFLRRWNHWGKERVALGGW